MRCVTCNIKFKVTYFNQKYCNNECKHKAEKQPKKKKVKKYKCKQCKEPFERTISSVQPVCSTKCAIEYSKAQDEKKRKKDWAKEKKQIKESLKTNSDHVQELQKIFNTFIRLRDAKKQCISCNKSLTGKYDAGHYKSAGGHPEHRFNEKNVHGQCVYCNQHLQGLIKRIGIAEVELLENYIIPMKYSIPELIELKVIYKDKIKQLKLNL